jgi:hypothetical protein
MEFFRKTLAPEPTFDERGSSYIIGEPIVAVRVINIMSSTVYRMWIILPNMLLNRPD